MKQLELKENEFRIYYKVKGRLVNFEKELEKLFGEHGYDRWASGYDLINGVRDLCFEKIKEK